MTRIERWGVFHYHLFVVTKMTYVIGPAQLNISLRFRMHGRRDEKWPRRFERSRSYYSTLARGDFLQQSTRVLYYDILYSNNIIVELRKQLHRARLISTELLVYTECPWFPPGVRLCC